MTLMNNFVASCCVAALAAAVPASSAAAPPAAAAPVKEGSLYLQCDGQPNNMTAGESAARLLGAVTLLGLFAPPPEGSDPSKRKFGAEGVEACTALIDGEKKEGNPHRRIGLILARALHRIEAKDYGAAIADAALARSEAVAAGLTADPYYARSQGLAFDMVEGAALFRLGQVSEARDKTVRGAGPLKHSVLGLLATPDYGFSVRAGSEDETRHLSHRSRAAAPLAWIEADRLEELGHFAEAARVRDALVDFDRASTPEVRSSIWMAQAAVSHALAGNKESAVRLAAEAGANFDARKAAGKPENRAAEFVELMDLYGIIATTDSGDMKTARRLFAARSQWVAASFGSVIEMNRRLRAGAVPDELIGGLAQDSEQLWKERADAKTAELLAGDSDNKVALPADPDGDIGGKL